MLQVVVFVVLELTFVTWYLSVAAVRGTSSCSERVDRTHPHTIVGVPSTKNSCKLRKSPIFSFYRIAQLIHQCLYKSHYTWCRRHIALDCRGRRSESSIHKQSKPCMKTLFTVFFLRCPAVRCLFKQRLLQKQPKHQILQQKMLYDALARRQLGRETVHNKGLYFWCGFYATQLW